MEVFLGSSGPRKGFSGKYFKVIHELHELFKLIFSHYSHQSHHFPPFPVLFQLSLDLLIFYNFPDEYHP